jgi:glycogen debranching enzyme
MDYGPEDSVDETGHDEGSERLGPARGQRSVRSPGGAHFEVVGRAGPVHRQGAPPIRAEAREELLVIKDGELFLCARPDGDVAAARVSGEGLYAHDTRYLSVVRLELGGRAPVGLSYSTSNGRATVDCTNAELRRGSSAPVPQLSLSITRELSIAAGRLYHMVRIHNFLREPLTIPLSLTVEADFADMFEVRGGVSRHLRGHALAPKHLDGDIVLAYVGEDEAFRECIVHFDPPPHRIALGTEYAGGEWELTLSAAGSTTVLMTAEPSLRGARRPARRRDQAIEQLARDEEAWRSACTRIETDNPLFNALIATASGDLRALTTPTSGGEILSAGIPWYVAAFGRDALLTAGEAMLLSPALSRDALHVLAQLQATEDDAWRDAEPGKILHELRIGELANAGIVPHSPYYGSADATPLFLIRAADYYAWTGDLETMAGLRPALDAAVQWIDEYGDSDGDGFVEYERRSQGGLPNQGWKDSDDAIVHADGRIAEGPIALVEVQGYVYLARLTIAGVYAALGDHSEAERLRGAAAALRTAFNDAFWNPAEGTFALALDGRKRQVASVTSNPGHCLYCGIIEPEKADAVADRLMAPDMFSGWGVRTLSTENPAFNPMSYHNGSVWPHDNAIVAAGIKRYGRTDAVARIAEALFDVATSVRDFRLPELYCGFSRAERTSVVAYPVACIPQAWAAAAPFLILQATLGLSARAPEGELRVEQPALPGFLGQVTVERLRVGDDRVTLSFERDAGVTTFAVLGQQGDLRVTMSAGR